VHVVGVSSYPEVLRVAARWVVAGVADMQAVRDLAIRKHPRKAMWMHTSSRPVSRTPNGDLPVSVGGARPIPKPTFLGATYSNARPKPGFGAF
jgi:hypothetical protein